VIISPFTESSALQRVITTDVNYARRVTFSETLLANIACDTGWSVVRVHPRSVVARPALAGLVPTPNANILVSDVATSYTDAKLVVRTRTGPFRVDIGRGCTVCVRTKQLSLGIEWPVYPAMVPAVPIPGYTPKPYTLGSNVESQGLFFNPGLDPEDFVSYDQCSLERWVGPGAGPNALTFTDTVELTAAGEVIDFTGFGVDNMIAIPARAVSVRLFSLAGSFPLTGTFRQSPVSAPLVSGQNLLANTGIDLTIPGDARVIEVLPAQDTVIKLVYTIVP